MHTGALRAPTARGDLQLAGVGRRVAAALIDGVVSGALYAFVCIVILALAPGNLLRGFRVARVFGAGWVLALLLGFGLLIYWLVPALLHTWQGQTLGKMIAGIQVLDDDGALPTFGACLLREAAYHLGNIVFFLSALWVFFDPDQQGLHDKVAHTLVVAAGQAREAPAVQPAPYRPMPAVRPWGDGVSSETQARPMSRGRETTSGREQANASLVVLQGSEPGREYRLFRGDVRIGRRGAGNDIIIGGDPSLSREHVLIREEHGYFTLFDRGSATGTFVNGHRVGGPVLLEHGDEIAMGNTRVRFVKLS